MKNTQYITRVFYYDVDTGEQLDSHIVRQKLKTKEYQTIIHLKTKSNDEASWKFTVIEHAIGVRRYQLDIWE